MWLTPWRDCWPAWTPSATKCAGSWIRLTKPSFSANQAAKQPPQIAALSAPAQFSAAQTERPAAQVAMLTAEPFPNLTFGSAQTVAPNRVVLVPATWREPASPRLPGVPAQPRPY
jgi:hypothetical protein